MKICWNKLTEIYLIIFFMVILIYHSINLPTPAGEWDDYSLPIASIMNGDGFSIAQNDIEVYKEIFPEWSDYIDQYSLSPFNTKDGRQLTWYFPIYSIVCIPVLLLLHAMKLPAIYTFPYSNIIFLMAALIITQKCLHVGEKRKMMLIALLSINPIIFYAGWASAEMFIYSLLVIAFVSWYNCWHKRAALFVSIAGMMNPTIMSIGFIMIAEYLICLIKNKDKKTSWINFIRDVWFKVISYGCCYIVGLVPMAYNYYHTGHINLTVSTGNFTHGQETTLARFFSYIFDLNYGILPYFCLLLIISIVLCIIAMFRKHWQYLKWILIFCINVFLYSIMTHINHGMSGIARYNAWGILPLLFAVCLFFDEILHSSKIILGTKFALSFGICLTGIIIFQYGPYRASNTLCFSFTPIAEWVLEHAPYLYNPLPSTFNCRTNYAEDGGYWYTLPVIYYDRNGYARKILLDQSAINYTKYSLDGNSEDMKWLYDELDKINEMTYLSIRSTHALQAANTVCLDTIWLSGDQYNAEKYITSGISFNEVTHTWTDGDEVDFSWISKDAHSNDDYYIHISVGGVINDKQHVILMCNDEEIYNETLSGASELIVPFTAGDNGLANFVMLLPDAVLFEDSRKLSLVLTSISFEQKATQY